MNASDFTRTLAEKSRVPEDGLGARGEGADSAPNGGKSFTVSHLLDLEDAGAAGLEPAGNGGFCAVDKLGDGSVDPDGRDTGSDSGRKDGSYRDVIVVRLFHHGPGFNWSPSLESLGGGGTVYGGNASGPSSRCPAVHTPAVPSLSLREFLGMLGRQTGVRGREFPGSYRREKPPGPEPVRCNIRLEAGRRNSTTPSDTSGYVLSHNSRCLDLQDGRGVLGSRQVLRINRLLCPIFPNQATRPTTAYFYYRQADIKAATPTCSKHRVLKITCHGLGANRGVKSCDFSRLKTCQGGIYVVLTSLSVGISRLCPGCSTRLVRPAWRQPGLPARHGQLSGNMWCGDILQEGRGGSGSLGGTGSAHAGDLQRPAWRQPGLPARHGQLSRNMWCTYGHLTGKEKGAGSEDQHLTTHPLLVWIGVTSAGSAREARATEWEHVVWGHLTRRERGVWKGFPTTSVTSADGSARKARTTEWDHVVYGHLMRRRGVWKLRTSTYSPPSPGPDQCGADN
ncbi:hypothetical protein Bbelb_090440 [Branchiostoma belcheri]|nr:hypothetical protein Bbelb_090440 [Branchiostoma belcheri]